MSDCAPCVAYKACAKSTAAWPGRTKMPAALGYKSGLRDDLVQAPPLTSADPMVRPELRQRAAGHHEVVRDLMSLGPLPIRQDTLKLLSFSRAYRASPCLSP
jgi:hypothetical protein